MAPEPRPDRHRWGRPDTGSARTTGELRAAERGVNDRARILARGTLTGEVSERYARGAILGDLATVGIVAEQVGKTRQSDQVRSDIHEAVAEHLTERCLIPGKPSSLNLHIIAAGKDVTAWARQLVIKMVHDEYVNQLRRRARLDLIDEPTHLMGHLDGGVRQEPYSWGLTQARVALVDAAADTCRGQRSLARIHTGARFAARVLNVPQPARPTSPRIRARVLAILDTDPAEVFRAAEQLLDHRLGRPTHDAIQPALQVLWAGYPTEHLAELAENASELAVVLARAAVTPRPMAPVAVIKETKRQVAALAPRDTLWKRTVNGLVDAHVAHFSDLPSEFSTAFIGAKPKGVRTARADEERWSKAAVAAAGHPGAPLGPIPAMVEQALCEFIFRVEDELASAKADERVTAAQSGSRLN